MPIISAGLLMCRLNHQSPEFFLLHPGGPFFAKKDIGVWSIPKGLPEAGETWLAAAQREFFEETGMRPVPPFYELGHIQQKGGKVVHAWAFEGEWDSSMELSCNTFTLEWPPRSGKKVEFPEMDNAQWYPYEEALVRIIPGQIPFLDRARDIFRREASAR